MIKFADIQNAFFFVSSDSYGMHSAILEKNTGLICSRSEMGDLDEMSDMELDPDSSITIPHRNDLNLGRALVYDIIAKHLPRNMTGSSRCSTGLAPMAVSRICSAPRDCFNAGITLKPGGGTRPQGLVH